LYIKIPYNWVVLHPRKISYNNQGTNLWSAVTIRMITLKMDENESKLGRLVTPPKFNIDPEKWWLEDDPFLLGR